MKYAGFWIRLLAAILDLIILGIPVMIIGFFLAYTIGSQGIYSLVELTSFAFMIYLEGIHGGTPGKLVLGLRIVNEQGKYIGIPGAILRFIGDIICGLTLGIGYLMILWDKKKQGLHDKIASTYVIWK